MGITEPLAKGQNISVPTLNNRSWVDRVEYYGKTLGAFFPHCHGAQLCLTLSGQCLFEIFVS